MVYSYEDEWFEETNVAKKIKKFLEKNDWKIIEFNENKRQKGPDIIAEKNQEQLVIEVKGYPSRYYVRGKKKGKLKPTPPELQATHWFAEAILSVLLKKSEDPKIKIAIGLPDFEKYRELINKIKFVRREIGIEFYLVKENGQIEIIS
jgi:Holliday junction resolvase-like predicted endonuclease